MIVFKTLKTKARPVHLAMIALFAVGLVVTGFRFLDAKEVGLVFSQLKLWSILPLLTLPVAFLWLKAERYADLFDLTPEPVHEPETRKLTMLSYASAQLATLLPGGYVARIALMEASLKRGAAAVLPTLIEKIADLSLLILVGLYACYFFPETQRYAALPLLVLGLGLVVCFWPGARHKVFSGARQLLEHFSKESLVRKIFDVRAPSRCALVRLALQSIGVLLIELAVLWGSFAALGLKVAPLVALMAYALSDFLGRIAPTPGGFGLTEVGMVALLHSFDGLDINQAAAATFLFRFLLFLLPAIYGSLCYVTLWMPLTGRRES